MMEKMTCAKFIVSKLIEIGTYDSFGIPGGVILDLIYEMEKSISIKAHLTYNEQTAAFAALGYAQASGKLGVAYATRGPGICNMFTAIAEAFQESIPVLFITAHGNREVIDGVRFISNQELDIVKSVKDITKFAANVNNTEDIQIIIQHAIHTALSERRGPVLIDIAANLWNKEIVVIKKYNSLKNISKNASNVIKNIAENINIAERPVLLIGDGLRYVCEKSDLIRAVDKIKIPILSSRGAQDLLSGSTYYYGYIGSHGIRYSNFILSKADLIIAIGNRMAFPFNSDSFHAILTKKIIRIDIDINEFKRVIHSEETYNINAEIFFKNFPELQEKSHWLKVCDKLRYDLNDEDCQEPVKQIIEFIKMQNKNTVYVCDVGNNEYWFARAYERCNCTEKVLTSKSFGTLGNAIGKAIGAYYSTRKNIVCVAGDQGFQFNIQELQYIAYHKLPIHILILNNNSSRMIADKEETNFEGKLLHVNHKTGYGTPNYKALAKAYGIENKLTEIKFNENIRLEPSLPPKQPIQDMKPALNREKYEMLNSL